MTCSGPRQAGGSSLAGGLLLVAAGFLLMDGMRWWERGVWLLIGAGGAFLFVRSVRLQADLPRSG